MSSESTIFPEILIFDGACGTTIQNMALESAVWGGHDGCNEYLNLSAPQAISAMHRDFIAAGANVIETNTFGANRIALREYGLQERTAEINRAAVANARAAASESAGVLVCGSLGPGTKLALLNQISVDELSAVYGEQIEALVVAGVDLLLFETCQDMLQIKSALVACFDTFARLGREVPVMVSVTIESSGVMLTGSDMAAIVTALEPFPLFSLGLNCATGPREMAEPLRYLARHWPHRISVMPNAGLPLLEGGRTIYPLEAEPFAEAVTEYVTTLGVSIVGGCCGTTAAHIGALATRLRAPGVRPAARELMAAAPALSSVYSSQSLRPEIPPFLIGERLNANGSKRFRELLLADDFEGTLKIAVQQESDGAMALDLCTAYTERDEVADMSAMTRLLRTGVKLPLMIDSTIPDVIEAVLRLHPGRCIINSINLEDGGANLDRICALAKRYGAAVVALVINQKGMAMGADDKVATAKEIYKRAVQQHGLRPGDILFDMLTFTIASGDTKLRLAAVETLNAIKRIKQELPGVGTVLGVSNISFGLSPAARRVLNSLFLHEAVAAGLDAAIVDVAKIMPLHKIGEEERQAGLDLIYDHAQAAAPDEAKVATALTRFIELFAAQKSDKGAEDESADIFKPVEERLTELVVEGSKEGLEELLDELLQRRSANNILNDILIPAMRQVGRLFASGELLLPFVLQSAETMKSAVRHLENFMPVSERRAGPPVVIATVQGDVHDIGKNLVGIILGNNGYTVHDLGIKVPAETIIAKAEELKAEAIGLSGLLVKSALVMRDNMELFSKAGMRQPVLLGGAALTSGFVARDCAPLYEAPVVYCSDAFDGLRALREAAEGRLESTKVVERTEPAFRFPRKQDSPIAPAPSIPTPPFFGVRCEAGITLDELIPFIDERYLFRVRWGYRRGRMGEEEHEALLRDSVKPLYNGFIERVRQEGLLQARVVYGYFHVFSKGDSLFVRHEGQLYRFDYPRQPFDPHLCLADYFRSEEEGGDVACFYVLSVGHEIGRATAALREGDHYRDYLLMHGLGVELTEALAECWHGRVRRDLAISGGERYGYGYAACPDLEAQRILFAMLEPERYGITLTESAQIDPEMSTSAIIVHHPQATYFAMK